MGLDEIDLVGERVGLGREDVEFLEAVPRGERDRRSGFQRTPRRAG